MKTKYHKKHIMCNESDNRCEDSPELDTSIKTMDRHLSGQFNDKIFVEFWVIRSAIWMQLSIGLINCCFGVNKNTVKM